MIIRIFSTTEGSSTNDRRQKTIKGAMHSLRRLQKRIILLFNIVESLVLAKIIPVTTMARRIVLSPRSPRASSRNERKPERSEEKNKAYENSYRSWIKKAFLP